MNTKLVDSLVRAIESLSSKERTLLETRLFFNTEFAATGLKVDSKVRVSRLELSLSNAV